MAQSAQIPLGLTPPPPPTSLPTAPAAMAVEPMLIHIKGMRCAACARNIEEKLRQETGIAQAMVNFATASAVLYTLATASNITAASVSEKLTSWGYPARAHEFTPIAPKASMPLWLGAVAVAIIFAADMVLLATHSPWRLPLIAMVVIATAAQICLGFSYYQGAWRGLHHQQWGMDSLIVVGTTAAFGLSLWQTSAHVVSMGITSPVWLAPLPHTYFDAAAMVLAFVTIGRAIEARWQHRTNTQLQSLQHFFGTHATRLEHGQPVRVSVEELRKGDHIVVAAGEKIPADGQVIGGAGLVDQNLFTGEVLPVEKNVGDLVWGGSLNAGQSLTLMVVQIGTATKLGFVRDLVRLATAYPSATGARIDRLCQYFVPAVIALAAATFVLWAAWDLWQDRSMARAMVNAISVLVIACPCAMGLAIPAALVNAIRLAGRSGIVIKDGGVFDRLATIDHIVLDKTGTLTMGQPALASITPFAIDRQQLLRLTASVLAQSRHPVAQAAVAHAQREGLLLLTPLTVVEMPGRGCRADFIITKTDRDAFGQQQAENVSWWVGNRRWLNENTIDLSPMDSAAAELSLQGQSVIYIGEKRGDGEKRVLGVIGLRDPLRAGSKELVAFFRERGLPVTLLSGDNQAAVQQLAALLSIDQALGDILPEEKAGRIKSLRARQHRVLMLGDGLNDAPALAQADIGVAMAGGSALAMQAASVGLTSNDPGAVVRLFMLGQIYRRTVKQNLWWAFGFNVLALPIAALGWVHPALAGMMMAWSSILVLANSARLGWQRI